MQNSNLESQPRIKKTTPERNLDLEKLNPLQLNDHLVAELWKSASHTRPFAGNSAGITTRKHTHRHFHRRRQACI